MTAGALAAGGLNARAAAAGETVSVTSELRSSARDSGPGPSDGRPETLTSYPYAVIELTIGNSRAARAHLVALVTVSVDSVTASQHAGPVDAPAVIS